jgi:hypothetical protein
MILAIVWNHWLNWKSEISKLSIRILQGKCQDLYMKLLAWMPCKIFNINQLHIFPSLQI